MVEFFIAHESRQALNALLQARALSRSKVVDQALSNALTEEAEKALGAQHTRGWPGGTLKAEVQWVKVPLLLYRKVYLSGEGAILATFEWHINWLTGSLHFLAEPPPNEGV